MKTVRLMALAAVLAAGTAIPAHAEWDRIGSVTVSPTREQTRVYGSFGGPVERLYFDADRSDVYCRSVRVRFANGRTRNVFTGNMDESRPVIVDLPGYQRNVRRIDFRCRALDRRTARIQISADIGSYRETWRRHPNFLRLWARAFGWDDDRPGRDRDEWVRLGSETFSGRERETTFAGFRGRDLTAIGLQPVDEDARCASIRVHFANGRTRNVRLGDRLREDRVYRVDLPGNERNVEQLELVCRPADGGRVTVNILGQT